MSQGLFATIFYMLRYNKIKTGIAINLLIVFVFYLI